MTRGGRGTAAKDAGGGRVHSLGGKRRKERVLDLPPQRHLRLRRRRAHAHRAHHARRIRPGGHGRASAVGHRREASAGHRRRHHRRHLSLVCRWSRHGRCVSPVCRVPTPPSLYPQKFPSRRRASADRAASRRKNDDRLEPPQKKPDGTFTAIPHSSRWQRGSRHRYRYASSEFLR